jgi:hypothetical protein
LPGLRADSPFSDRPDRRWLGTAAVDRPRCKELILMADAERDRTKTEAAPESTWGATEEAKAAWERKYGTAASKSNEKKDDEK